MVICGTLGPGFIGQDILRYFTNSGTIVDDEIIFCDNYSEKKEIDGCRVIKLDELLDIAPEHHILIAENNHFARKEIVEYLNINGIDFTIWGLEEENNLAGRMIHIHGVFPEIIYEYNDNIGGGNIDPVRIPLTINFFKAMIEKYKNDFTGKIIDMYIYTGDNITTAYELMRIRKYPRIFAYSTLTVLKDDVIPIPDQLSYWQPGMTNRFDPDYLKELASYGWEDSRAIWSGSLETNEMRQVLYIMGEKFPNYLYVEPLVYRPGFSLPPMSDWVKFKYIIDVRGYGWTERVKILLKLGRPLLLVDRPYKEWFFDKLIPMEHYVPVKEDLSNLIERIEYLEAHPQCYTRIVNNMKKFVDEYLNSDKVLDYLRDITLHYGIIEDDGM